MAVFTGGDILEIRCQHSTGDYTFEAKSNESFNIDLGGIRISDDANGITGSGSPIYQKNRVRWFFEGAIVVNIVTGKEMNALNTLAESNEEGVWTISIITGAIYKGKGVPVGDFQTDTNATTLSLKVSGGGKLELL